MRRYLPGNKGTEAPGNLLFFDCETHEPDELGSSGTYALKRRLWCAIAVRLEAGQVTRREVVRGTTAEEFWTFVGSRIRPKQPLWAFCHNAACDWTWLDLWGELRAGRLWIKPTGGGVDPKTGKKRRVWKGRMVLESRPAFVVCRHAHGTLKLVDTGNYWTDSIWEIGRRHGLPKLDMPRWEAPEEAWYTYCERDCEILEKAVTGLIAWWVKEDCGTFQLTAPALSMQHFRHTSSWRVGDSDAVRIVQDPNAPYHVLERNGYYGPRFEAFYKGPVRGPLYKVDCNSCYLSVMERETFPWRYVGKCPDATPEGLLRSMEVYGAVAQVRMNARGNTYPARLPAEPLQVHVTGQFWTTLCGPELRRALRAGDVAEVGETNLYAMGPIFKGWARQWHDRKVAAVAAGDLAHAEFCKLVGNSLSGKWGQHGIGWRDVHGMSEWVECRVWCHYDHDTGETVYYRSIPGGVQRWESGDEPRHCSPIVSAYISSYAREIMRDVITGLPERSCLYVASDALIIDSNAHTMMQAAGLLDPTEMGKFKVEGPYTDGEIVGTNCYRIGPKWVRAGFHGKPRPGVKHKVASVKWERLPGILSRPINGEVRFTESPWAEIDPRPKGKPDATGWYSPIWISFDPQWSDLACKPVLEGVYKAARPTVPSQRL